MKPVAVLWIASLASVTPGGLAQTEPGMTREGAYWVRSIQGTLDGPQVGRLRVMTVGVVVLKGGAGANGGYVLRARVKARDPREAAALLRQLDVRTRAEGGWLNLTVIAPRSLAEAPELTVTAPQNCRAANLETRGGEIRASDFAGDLEARSAGGAIHADSIRGNIDVRTGGGDIEVGTVGGTVHCYSGGGVIRVASAGGESRLETAGGDIFVHDAKGPLHVDTAGGNIGVDQAAGIVFARTAAGLIQVRQAGGVVTAESSGGAIQVNSAHGVRCDSAAGAIRLTDVAGPLRASTNAGSILTELHPGNRIEDSSLSTNAGDITVLIASGIPITVLARNESGGLSGRIISDFPEIHVRPATSTGANSVVAEGALYGGGPVLRISVAGGTIYLRRQK